MSAGEMVRGSEVRIPPGGPFGGQRATVVDLIETGIGPHARIVANAFLGTLLVPVDELELYFDAADASERRLRIMEAGGFEPVEHPEDCIGPEELDAREEFER